jgi:DNA polymerase III subunit delta
MIIFLYGEDTFRSKQKLNELKDKFSRDIDPSMLNIEELDGEKITTENFKQVIGTGGFLVKKRMIIVENLIGKNKNKKTQEEVVGVIKKIEERGVVSDKQKDDNIIIFWEELGVATKDYKSKKLSGELYEYLKECKYVFEFLQLDNIKLASWIRQKFNLKEKEIKPEAVNLLVSLVGSDMWKLNNEINKLVAGGDIIIEIDKIKELVSENFNDNIFELTDAVAEKNKKTFLYLLERHLRSGADSSYLLSMLTRQFRILLQAKSILEEDPYANLSTELKIPFFVEKKIKNQAGKYSLDQLKKIYGQLVAIDIELKTSYFDPELLFYKLII